MSGYPILCELTVPHMKQYIANNRDQNQINVQILLEIIGELTDTNVISRTSEKEMRWLQTEARAILKTGGAFCAEGLQSARTESDLYPEKYESGRSCGFTCGNDFFVPHGNLDGTFEKYNIIKIYDAVIDLKMYGRS